jgi:hypothetical protein
MERRTAYYLAGMGGRLHTELGQALQEKGFMVLGRELVDDLALLAHHNSKKSNG